MGCQAWLVLAQNIIFTSMRAVIQRVSEASVSIDGAVKSQIGAGLLILLGIENEDGQEDINGNGMVDSGEADPLNFDSDGDGLTDGYEINIVGTDPTSPTAPCGILGDMNNDGDVNVGDLLLLQRQIMGL